MATTLTMRSRGCRGGGLTGVGFCSRRRLDAPLGVHNLQHGRKQEALRIAQGLLVTSHEGYVHYSEVRRRSHPAQTKMRLTFSVSRGIIPSHTR